MSVFTSFSRLYRVIVSVFILVVLGAQASSTLIAQIGYGMSTTGSRYWPILVYDMYAKARHKDETIDVNYLLDGVLDNGQVIRITWEHLGLDFWHYLQLTRSIVGEQHIPGRTDSADTLSELLRKQYPDLQFVKVLVKTYPLKLAREGAVPAESEVIFTMPVKADTASGE